MSYDYSQSQQPQYEDDYAEIDSLITQEDWSALLAARACRLVVEADTDRLHTAGR